MKFGKFFIFLFSLILTGGLAQTAQAGIFSSDRNGAYIGADLGVAFQQDLKLNSSDNDFPTECDQFLRALVPDDNLYINIDEMSFASGGDCERGQDTWKTTNKMGSGIIAGAQAGYIFGNFRIEAEYAYRSHNSDERENVGEAGPKSPQFSEASQAVTNLSSHSLFANVYYDLVNQSPITPYLGAGAGWANISMIYDAVFARHFNPANLPPETPDEAAGTVTYTDDRLTDSVFGWQIIAGADHEIDKNWSIGLKFRYSRFGKFEDGDKWDLLRSHESAISSDSYADNDGTDPPNSANAQTTTDIQTEVPGFDPTVTYEQEIDDISVWSAAVNLKYRFGGGGSQ